MKNKVLPLVLKNALNFKGNVHEKAILGLVLRTHPELKKEVRKVLQEINDAIKSIEGKDLKDIKKQLEELAPELLTEKKEEIAKGPLKALPDAEDGKVVVRIAPSPSGPLHIGHAYGASLNYEYAKMYKGKFIVRIEDTNPENLYEPAYDLIVEDAKWLSDDNVSGVVIQSSRLDIYYKYAKELVDMGKAYVCLCDPDTFREMKSKGLACQCRDLALKEQQSRYTKMFEEYAEGESVLRLKTDIKHKNPAMRDFAIMRVNEHVHPKTGKEKRVWPLMVFSVAIDDHELGITHVMNGKEHADNSKKEALIMELFDWNVPVYKHWGRINFEGFKVSASKTRIAIEHGEYKGWDDIRLPFLPALRKRGYQPGAFRKFAMKIGLSLTDKTVKMEEFWKMVNAFNKELVEPIANRYFFVDNPQKITIDGMNEKNVEIDLHPDDTKRGSRKLTASGNFYISEDDVKILAENKIHRLMDCCNFKVEGDKYLFVSDSVDEYKNAENKGKIIHWVPVKEAIPCEVLQSNGEVSEGICEKMLGSAKEGDIVQLERRYFARVDSIGDKVRLWYLHK
jgi:glutamyl-tRNA synthetase